MKKPLALLLLSLLFIPLEYCNAQSLVSVMFTQKQIANIKIGEEEYASLRWEMIGQDVQVYWNAYNDPSTVLGQYIVLPDYTYIDPQKSLYITWNGTITLEGRITLVMESVMANKQVTVQYAIYTGSTSPFGKPSTTYHLTVATIVGKTYLVYLAGSPKWGFQFSLVENGSVPLLYIYDGNGHLETSYYVTSYNQSYEYGGVEGLGFTVQKVISAPFQVVKTTLYAGLEITVKPVSGWGTTYKPFPNAAVTPNKVQPDQQVQVVFTIPEGASGYSSNLASFPTTEPVTTYDPATNQYTVTFSFLSQAQGKLYTIVLGSTVGEIEYQSSLPVEVLNYAYMQYLVPTLAITVSLCFAVLIIFLWRRRSEPLHPEMAYKTSQDWS